MMRATSFWTSKAYVDKGFRPNPSLNIHPEGQHRGGAIEILFQLRTTPDEQLAIAEEVLAGVQKWRDDIAAYAEQQRTATDELERLRAELAAAKAEAGAV